MNADKKLVSTPGWAKRLWVACRPWSAPISTVPVLLGAGAAVLVGGAPLAWDRLVLSWLAHAAANLLSDLADYRSGLDREPLPVSGALFRGWLTERQTLIFGLACLALSTAIGLWLAFRVGPIPLYIAAAGFALALSYPVLKHIAAGDAAVFAAFGPLIAAGTWSVFTGHFSWIPVIWSAPFGMIVIAVLHANNWRDMRSDREHGVITVAGVLGEHASRWYYGALIFGAFALTAALVLVPRVLTIPGLPPMPCSFFLVFLTLPRAWALWRRAMPSDGAPLPPERLTLDAATAQFMVPFGALNLLALLLAAF